MVGFTGIGLLLLTPAAPVPAPPPRPATTTVDRREAFQFAHLVYRTAQVVQNDYYPPTVGTNDLVAAAIRGMYEEAGLAPPAEVLRAADRAGAAELLDALVDARLRLGHRASLSGPRAMFAAINGFRHATDPTCVLASPSAGRTVAVDMDYGVGLELDGASGQRWGVYWVEHGMAVGSIPRAGVFGPIPKPDEVPSPAVVPWRVKRVVPGSPAQRGGVKPGDIITHFGETEIAPDNANQLFARLAFPPGGGFDPSTGQLVPIKRTFTFLRADGSSVRMPLESRGYTPEGVFGVLRSAEDKWDCVLDRQYKIGYVRVGPIEEKADERLGEMLDDLNRRGCRGLILDLRWCPGGYVREGTGIAGLFLRAGTVIAPVRVGHPNGSLPGDAYQAAPPPTGGRFLDRPVVVLVGSETAGGGELIAAALQDNGRAVVMGQRTVGRAVIQSPTELGFGGLRFKVTTGATLRPNGKSRGKTATSRPTDDWGVRPDPGLEVPITADLSTRLRRWAEDHALRPAGSRDALPFDDPAKDPYRSAALSYLHKRLGLPKPEPK